MNLYAAPKSPLDESIPGKSSTAPLIGAAIGLGTSLSVLTVVGIIYSWVLTFQGVPLQELYLKIHQSSQYQLFAQTVAFLCFILGGYWSARLSLRKPLATAMFAGAIVAAFSVITNFMPYDLPIPLWSRFASIITPFPSFVLGAWLWQRAAQVQQ